MAIHTSTAPAHAGERTRSPKSQIGPVTAAVRMMRKAERIDDAVQALAALRQHDPEIDSIPALCALRSALADRIGADIALLDALDGDPNLEDGHDAEDTDDNGIADFDGMMEQSIARDSLVAL